jgi:hypothetical protein
MVSRYHWVTAGIDAQFNGFLPAAQSNPMTIPAGGVLKRFQARRCKFGARSIGTDENFIFDLAVNWEIHFTSGPNNGRDIFQSTLDIPFEAGTFVPITGYSRWAYWHAGDRELGVNEGCSYGKSSGAAANLQFTYSWFKYAPNVLTGLRGEWSFQCAALYYL